MKKPILVLIGGGSGSGKTTIAKMISDKIAPNIKTKMICQDSYYIDRIAKENMLEDDFNYDHPSAFDWKLLKEQINLLLNKKSISLPVYDYNKRKKHFTEEQVYDCDVIILEGIYALYDKELNDISFMKVFVETAKDECLARRLERDIENRGRSLKIVLKQWRETVRPMYDQYIEPLKLSANIILPWHQEGNEKGLQALIFAIENYFNK